MQCSYSHDIVPDELLPYMHKPLKCYFSTTSPRIQVDHQTNHDRRIYGIMDLMKLGTARSEIGVDKGIKW